MFDVFIVICNNSSFVNYLAIISIIKIIKKIIMVKTLFNFWPAKNPESDKYTSQIFLNQSF